jgi:hypothetical protein
MTSGGPLAPNTPAKAADVAARRHLQAAYVVWFDGVLFHADSGRGGIDFVGTDSTIVSANALAAAQ